MPAFILATDENHLFELRIARIRAKDRLENMSPKNNLSSSIFEASKVWAGGDPSITLHPYLAKDDRVPRGQRKNHKTSSRSLIKRGNASTTSALKRSCDSSADQRPNSSIDFFTSGVASAPL